MSIEKFSQENVGNIGEVPMQDEKKPKTGAKNMWTEYLQKTGNPELKNMSEGAGIELDLMKETNPQKRAALQEKLSNLQEKNIQLAAESLGDMFFSSNFKIELTGDIKTDSEKLFSLAQAEDFLSRLENNENPKQLLEEFKTNLNRVVLESSSREDARKMTYSALQAIHTIDDILGGKKNEKENISVPETNPTAQETEPRKIEIAIKEIEQEIDESLLKSEDAYYLEGLREIKTILKKGVGALQEKGKNEEDIYNFVTYVKKFELDALNHLFNNGKGSGVAPGDELLKYWRESRNNPSGF